MSQMVYLETSVISYLTARLSRDLLVAGHQQATQAWWENERHHYDVVVSELVYEEAGAGNPELAARRLTFLDHLRVIEITNDAIDLAGILLQKKAVPEKAAADALHIAACAVHEVSFLLTWNCKHINNPFTRHQIDKVCRDAVFEPAVICTPEELLEG